ncbi:ABC transporter ATP-binding protein [Calditrichota bacterium]
MTEQKEESILSISGLTKLFGSFCAVDGISFKIRKGEIFGLLGPNGAGKTTTINMICGLLPFTSGEIVFNGKKLSANNSHKHIGVCPQDNVFWPKLTCYEQLCFVGSMYDFPAKVLKVRANELLALMGLEEKANVHANKLSGGMKRRLNICLALIHDPHILILDEPEAGLDPQSRILVRNFIKSLSRQKTVILTTHNIDEAERLSDRVAIIDHGKLLLLETPSNLKKSIGEGDTLEIVLEKKNQKQIDQIVLELSRQFNNVKLHDTMILINARNLIESVAPITEKIKNAGSTIISITLRENTLEDVFIHLTGRKLRQ